ncbi:MAG: S8 family serine peptidase [Ignavibacteriaceae bacterium]|nr:MAG: S8 family serine peptidase [Ignavibacteriaceae bacterium]
MFVKMIKMKKILLLPFLALLTFSFQGSVTSSKLTENLKVVINRMSDQDSIACWVFLKDKGQGSQKLFKTPEKLVSKRSLERRKKYLPADELVNTTDLPVYGEYLKSLESIGLVVKSKSKWLNSACVQVTKAQVKEIERLPFVSKIDLVMRFSKRYTNQVVDDPETKQFQNEPNSKNEHALNYGKSLRQNEMMNVPALHDLGITGKGVLVGVFDTGFNNLEHKAFENIDILAAWDFVNGDSDVSDGTDAGEGSHGTNVLSAIGGYSSGNLIGPAYGATFLLAKTENTDSETPLEEDNWISAIEWADSIGVDLVTSSLGYLDYDPPFHSYSWKDMDGNTARITIAADMAVGKGIAVFISAGNEGPNALHNTLSAPADGDSVIAVGAVDQNGSIAYFSSVGPTVDGRIKPDILALGFGVRVAGTLTKSGYSLASGTSFSCPLAAGVGVLLLSQQPWLSPVQLADVLRSTAGNSLNPNNEMGWGVVNALDALNAARSFKKQ